MSKRKVDGMESNHMEHRMGDRKNDQNKPMTHEHGQPGGMGHHEMLFRRKFWVSLALSIPVIVFSPTVQGWLGYNVPDFPLSQWIVPVFAIIVFIVGGLPFFSMSKGELKKKQPGMMTLISLALAVSFLYSIASTIFSLSASFYWELVTLIDVMLLGHWIEMRSVRQASGALDELSKLLPDTAERIVDENTIETVKVAELNKGDLVLVRPGASVPADGEVVAGSSSMNESMITGESQPVSKQVGDKVVSGTINGDGSLRIGVMAVGDETTLAGIMRLVAEAQQSKSRSQILADKAAGWLFYIALGVAAITAVAWLIAEGWNIDVLNRVTTVLVIACPHALGLAIPLVVAISTSIGASNGILIRDRVALEAARNLDVIVFDKTGTLTEGEFGLNEMKAFGGLSDDQALVLAAALERDSEHPIAKAIRKAAEEKGMDLPEVQEFNAIKGKGIQGKINGAVYHLGSPRLVEEQKANKSEEVKAFLTQADQSGETVVFLTEGNEVVAGFGLADRVREDSAEVVWQLHEQGYQVAMLTGDSEAVAKTVAEKLGIDRYFAEVLPENKDQKIRQLQEEGQKVAMVGDGVNDAPALTRADVGIAIGSGTDVAIESAGIILVDSDPMDILRVIKLSKATFRKMRQNLIWATGYNVIALPLAAGVLAPVGFTLPPAVGALIMSISTVVVAINAQLLRKVKNEL
jgi:Cu2+-exporting ATPase